MQNILKISLYFQIAVLLLCLSKPSDAAIIVSYGAPTNIVEGQSGTVDVFIRSTEADTDFLAAFSAEFRIETVVGSVLAFSNPQSESHIADPNYVFGSDTFGASSGLVNSPLVYIGGDGTFSGNPVVLPTTNALLFRLDLDASQATAGAQFRISLVNDATTSFLDDAFEATSTVNSSSFTNFATVNITAVPEPGTLAVMFSVGLYGGYRRLRTRSAGRNRL